MNSSQIRARKSILRALGRGDINTHQADRALAISRLPKLTTFERQHAERAVVDKAKAGKPFGPISPGARRDLFR